MLVHPTGALAEIEGDLLGGKYIALWFSFKAVLVHTRSLRAQSRDQAIWRVPAGKWVVLESVGMGNWVGNWISWVGNCFAIISGIYFFQKHDQ